ncbi:hypothetical protein [Pseudomonas fragi]|uniref:hypothetical protein n=1 Tax=Pseudomonas fragi TaxID=296 RepID=UPI0028FC314D|nr:hypothetical protein [Pseudomonas fragi]
MVEIVTGGMIPVVDTTGGMTVVVMIKGTIVATIMIDVMTTIAIATIETTESLWFSIRAGQGPL